MAMHQRWRSVGAVVAGFIVTALLSVGTDAVMHAAGVFGAIGVVAATAGAVATWNAGPAFGPKWYPVLLIATALPCVWAGGRLRRRGTLI